MGASSSSPLRIAVFRNFWIAGSVSNVGSIILTVAASWHMISIAQSAEQVALVQTFATMPIVLLSVSAGAVADILDRRLVMLIAQSFMFCASCGLTVLVVTVGVSPSVLLILVFFIGCGAAIHGPAWHASVGDQVPSSDLPSAVALNSLGLNLARSLGPALGGILIATGGIPAAFAASALASIGLIAVLLFWRPAVPDTTLPREDLASAMLAGIRFATLSPLVPALLLRGLLFGAGAGALPALLPLIARENLSGAVLTFGVLLGSYGTGSVVGALSSSALRSRFQVETLVRWSSAIFAVSSVTVAFSTNAIVSAILLLPAGACWVVALVSLNVSVQLSVPRWVIGRVLALFQMMVYAGISGGSWIWGLVAEHQGCQAALALSALMLLVCYAAGFWFPVHGSHNRDFGPRSDWQTPKPAPAISGRSGPVAVEIQWRIATNDVPHFAQLMLGRRRMFSRNGARFWTLARDTQDPENWSERYEIATWFDYLRLNERITRDDAGYFEELAKLEKAVNGPSVRRTILYQPRTLTGDSPPDTSMPF
ncbi:MFS transporter [Rhizobium leguminosarum]|uniref:MFS transporter n=2 Tax=Rhizobium leguminosarum TaxID=384 RepID=UPI001440EF99|nr:MFS transporter [Rhizobium leguminosarum]